MVDSTPVLLGAMKKYPDKFEVVGTFGEPFWVGWVTRPEDLDLRDAINVGNPQAARQRPARGHAEEVVRLHHADPGLQLSAGGRDQVGPASE